MKIREFFKNLYTKIPFITKGYEVFILSFFLVPKNINDAIFYLFIIPAAFISIYKDRLIVDLFKKSFLFKALVLTLAYIFVIKLITFNLKPVRYVISMFSFIYLSLFYLDRVDKKRFHQLLRNICIVMSFVGVLEIIFYAFGWFDARRDGFVFWPVIGASSSLMILHLTGYSTIALYGLFKFFEKLKQKSRFKTLLPYIFSYFITWIMIIISFRKGPFISYAIASFLIFIYYRRKYLVALSLTAGTLLILTVVHLVHPFISENINEFLLQNEIIQSLYERGDSKRLMVWGESIMYIKQYPLLGTPFEINIMNRFQNPHNLIIESFFRFGLPVFIAFCFIFLYVFIVLLKNIKGRGYALAFFLYFHSMLANMTDGRLISSNHIGWITIWLPIILVIYYKYKEKEV